jgi:cytochrome c553
MRRILRPRYLVLALSVLVIVVAVTSVSAAPTQGVQAGALYSTQAQKPDNSACLACHGQPGQSWKLPSGEVLGNSVDPAVYDMSAHNKLDCKICHTNISAYPHPKNTAQNSRDYTLQYKDTCKQCHASESQALGDSIHTKLLNEGNKNAPVCSDCHNAHSQPPVKKTAQGEPAPEEHANVAKICARCHNTIYEQYLTSVHGSGIVANKNLDVPSCTDCHGVHKVLGPDSPGFKINSPTQVCGKCHTNETIMKKYGISTEVMNTYVADFHGTTITLFQATDPDAVTNKPVCYDCHGVHDIMRTDDPKKGIQVKQNMLVACQRCHPDATENFPESWLSHYIPSPDKYPLVYYVNLFYVILIPVVLGGMVLYIATDLYRRLVLNRRAAGGKPAAKSGKK